MLTDQDLIAYFHAGSKKPEDCKIGLELEQFSFNKATGLPLPYDGEVSVSALLNKLVTDYGWQPYIENGVVIALKRKSSAGDIQTVSLEPGGQVELSGAVYCTIDEVKQTTREFCQELYTAGDSLGIGFQAIGLTPNWKRSDFHTMPKQRYQIMKNYMPSVGTMGHDMMFRTCTVQLNMDYTSEADMIQKMRVAIALQPLATAFFANSITLEGKDTGYKSYRSYIWTHTDNERTGILPFMFSENAGFEAYKEYALDVPMYFIERDGKYIDCAGLSFRDFMMGKLSALPNEYPTVKDWEDHLSTIFPEVRLKNFIEMRGADSNPLEKSLLIADFWVHLIYNQNNLDMCSNLIKNWSTDAIWTMRMDAAQYGLEAMTPDGEKLSELFHRLFEGNEVLGEYLKTYEL